MKLAKRLHPDKSKTEETAEQFKMIVNAHSTLTDRLKRKEYDTQLRVRNLFDYNPSGTQKSKEPVKQKPRRSRPYDDQPYGFGLSSEKKKTDKKNNRSSVPIFQSFNLKSYQRYYNQKHELQEETYRNNKYRQADDGFDVDESEEDGLNDKNEEDRLFENFSEKVNEVPTTRVNEEVVIEIESDNNVQDEVDNLYNNNPKRSKVDGTSNVAGNSERFWNHALRRSARNKFENREQKRRSVSPIKDSGTSANADIEDSFTSGITNIINQLYEKVHNDLGERTKRSDTDIKDLSIDENGSDVPSKRRKTYSTEGEKTDPLFNMRNINETLDSIPMVKKAKLSADYSNTSTHESIHEPVNYTLPRFYKNDLLPTSDDFDMKQFHNNLDAIIIPEVPSIDLKKSKNLYELEVLKQEVTRFNQTCNELKAYLIGLYSERIHYDSANDKKLFKIENFRYLFEGSNINFDIIKKIRTIEQNQHLTIQNFIKLNGQVYDRTLMNDDVEQN